MLRCAELFWPAALRTKTGNLSRVQEWIASARLPRARANEASRFQPHAASYSTRYLPSVLIDRGWDHLRPGDVANLDGTGSIFAVDVAH